MRNLASFAVAFACCVVPAAAADMLFTGQTFAVYNGVAAADFFTRLGTPGTAVVDGAASAFNADLTYGYTIETAQEDLGENRGIIRISLTHEDYFDGAGDFYPSGFEVGGQPLLHRVFGFGGSSEPDALVADMPLNIDLLRFETFVYDGVEETRLDDFVPISSSTPWTGGIGYWNPPPGETVGNGINRIAWTAEFTVVPEPTTMVLFAVIGLSALRRR